MSNKKTPTNPNSEAEYIIYLAKSKKSFRCNSTQAILSAADKQSIQMKNACRLGRCGFCKCPLIEGEVEYSQIPKASNGDLDGIVFPCQAKPKSNIIIDA